MLSSLDLGGLGPLGLVALVFLVAAVFVQGFGFFCMLWFRFRPLPKLQAAPYPGVSVVKCCFDNVDNEEENFRHFFEQTYPGKFELLFVVGNIEDPIVPTIRRYLARYPQVDAQLIVSTSKIAHWNKVNSLYDAQCRAKHDIIIWSDSDVVVRPTYLEHMVASLQEPGVSVVTTPQYDFRVNNFATALKVIANNCDDATFMMAYNALNRRKVIALGHSLGFWKSEFEAFGDEAWDILTRFIGDDLGLPYLYNRVGKRVVFRNIYCPVQYSSKTLAQVIEQKRRWVMCQKQVVGNSVIYLSGCLFYPEVPSLFLMLFSGFQSEFVALFFAMIGMRAFISGTFESLFLGFPKMTLRWGWTVVLWDLAQMYFVLDGFRRRHIRLKGRKFRIHDRFFLVPIDQA